MQETKDINMENISDSLGLTPVLEKSAIEFLEEHGILTELSNKRIEFIKVKARRIENTHKDVLLNAMPE